MIELNSADKLCFGKDEDCVEYVFEMPPIFPPNNQSTKKLCGIPNCSTTNSPEKFRQQTPFNYYHEEKSIKDEEPIFLPIVGVSFHLFSFKNFDAIFINNFRIKYIRASTLIVLLVI